MLTRLRRVLALVAVGGVATLARRCTRRTRSAATLCRDDRGATSRENFMQIACGPEAVRSHAVIEMRMGSSTFNLRQEDATECNGLWAPLWAAQPIVLHWAFAVPILFDIGPGSISFSDTDWINGPRRRLTSHFHTVRVLWSAAAGFEVYSRGIHSHSALWRCGCVPVLQPRTLGNGRGRELRTFVRHPPEESRLRPGSREVTDPGRLPWT